MHLSTNLEDFIRFSEDNFILKKGEEKKILVDFLALESKKEDIYLGKIFVGSGSVQREIAVSVEIESQNPLFDIRLSIPDKYKKVGPGDEIIAQVTLLNLERVGIVDTRIDYSVRDLDNNVILEEHETVAVETQTSFVKSFRLPNDIKDGKYSLYAKVSYDGQSGSSSAFFDVAKFNTLGYVIFLIFVLVIILVFVIYHIRMKKSKIIDNSDNYMKRRSEFSNRTIRKTNDPINRIVHKNKVLRRNR